MGIELIGKNQLRLHRQAEICLHLFRGPCRPGIFRCCPVVEGQANMGIDFAGGTSVQLKFEKPFQLNKGSPSPGGQRLKDTELQQFTEGNKLLIQVKKAVAGERVADKILAIFTKEFGDNKFVVDSTTEIGLRWEKSCGTTP